MQDRGTTVRVRLKMEAKFLPDADSSNVVGEIRGRERPDEVVVVGGHFDSWDVGTGSTDDGGGCVVTWEALRLMKKLNLRPRRTVRVVLLTNEENGLRGGRAYRERYRDAARQPRADARVRQRRLPPDGLRLHRQRRPRARRCRRSRRCSAASRPIRSARPAAAPTSARASRPASIPAMSLEVDGNYFLIHHTPADTVDKIDPMDMAQGVGRDRRDGLRRSRTCPERLK